MRCFPFCVSLFLIVLTACGREVPAQPSVSAEPSVSVAEVYIPTPLPKPEPEIPAVYKQEPSMTPEEVIAAYFEQHYLSYINLTYINIDDLLDVEYRQICRNITIWSEALIQRRRLISEHDFCYVETDFFDYTINFIDEEELADERTEFWSRYHAVYEEEITIHFVIEGEKGKAYPPIMAVNAQHTMRLQQLDGRWRITFHYFPGSRRKFISNGEGILPSPEEMLVELEKEFSVQGDEAEISVPDSATAYNGDSAAEYAALYTETPNSEFYHIGDWMGNCANFTSQSIWSGFRGEDGESNAMTDTWYAGSGGGSPAWENVGNFWDFAVENGGLSGMELLSPLSLRRGDLIQTVPVRLGSPNSEDENDDEQRFNHSLVVIDEEKLVLGQNSPACFVYYSDLINVETRMFRPGYGVVS